VKPYYQDDAVTIYHGDCQELLPAVSADAVVTDPPYGVNWGSGGGRFTIGNGTGGKRPRVRRAIAGDDVPFDPAPLLAFPEVLLWGFNHFPQHLQQGTALVWIKRYDDGFLSFLSDAEIAWLNKGHGVYCRRDTSLQGEQRLHPTQKPLGIMKWCISFVAAETILDPYMGSGTTLVAAKQLGRKAIGIEIEERYCEIAARRCAQEVLAL
jgi:site-specific DNA-methyltransferase (adenine-specific)